MTVIAKALDIGNEPMDLEVQDISYHLGNLKIIMEGESQSVIAQFENVAGFRVLDERDLIEFWPTCSTPNGSIFEIQSGGWLEQECKRDGFLLAHMEKDDVVEYLLAGVDDCVNVIARNPPEIKSEPSNNRLQSDAASPRA